MKILFWILFLTLFYTYPGYAVLIFFLTLFKKKKKNIEKPLSEEELPEICLFITAYNELPILPEKVENCRNLDYPENKLNIVFITDGSNDGSQDFLKQHNNISVYHNQERKGKMHAMNRGMQYVKSPITVFTDANTSLNREALKEITDAFTDPVVGCVAGRKKVINTGSNNAAETGEGLYWKYESWLKENDAKLYSAVGAVGDLEPADDGALRIGRGADKPYHAHFVAGISRDDGRRVACAHHAYARFHHERETLAQAIDILEHLLRGGDIGHQQREQEPECQRVAQRQRRAQHLGHVRPQLPDDAGTGHAPAACRVGLRQAPARPTRVRVTHQSTPDSMTTMPSPALPPRRCTRS